MDSKKFLYLFTKLMVDLMFYGGIVLCLVIPYLIYRYTSVSPMLSVVPLQTGAVLVLSGIAAIFILWEIKHIFRTLINKDESPFIMANVISLKRMAIASFIITVIYIYKCFFWFTLATAIIIIIFAIAGLFCLVLANVFEQAVRYKEENDLTV